MSDHAPLPVAGYKPQSTKTIDTVNAYKRQEERLLRSLDDMAKDPDIDKRWLAIGRTKLEEAFMAINRSVFKPGRVALPEDAHEYKGISYTKIEEAAKAAHEANRRLQIENKEAVISPSWDETDAEVKESGIVGIKRVIDNPFITSEDLHESWLETKRSQGWRYGEVRSNELKLHNCMVPYAQLPASQQLKDKVFRDTVLGVLGLLG